MLGTTGRPRQGRHVDSYVVAGIADHICPWESCYRTTQLLGGDSRFVLSTSGHIAAMVNPPGNPKASFQTAEQQPGRRRRSGSPRPRRCKGSLVARTTSAWLGERTGPERSSRAGSARRRYEPVCDAPGTYVLDR